MSVGHTKSPFYKSCEKNMCEVDKKRYAHKIQTLAFRHQVFLFGSVSSHIAKTQKFLSLVKVPMEKEIIFCVVHGPIRDTGRFQKILFLEILHERNLKKKIFLSTTYHITSLEEVSVLGATLPSISPYTMYYPSHNS